MYTMEAAPTTTPSVQPHDLRVHAPYAKARYSADRGRAPG